MNKPIIPAACSLTPLFTNSDPEAYTTGAKTLVLNDYPEPVAEIISNLKMAFQQLQLELIVGKPKNMKEIGAHFDEFEFYLDDLIWKFKKPASQ